MVPFQQHLQWYTSVSYLSALKTSVFGYNLVQSNFDCITILGILHWSILSTSCTESCWLGMLIMKCNFERCLVKKCTCPWKLGTFSLVNTFKNSDVGDIIRYSFKMKNEFIYWYLYFFHKGTWGAMIIESLWIWEVVHIRWEWTARVNRIMSSP